MSNETTALSSAESKVYSKIKLRISFFSMITDFLILCLLSFSTVSRDIVNYIDFHYYNQYLQFFFFVCIVGIIFLIPGLLIDYYGGFFIEHQFGLSNQNRFAWFFEKIKSIAISSLIFLPIAMVFFIIVRNANENWWWIFSLILIFFSLILARIAPILIFPLFYTFKPVQNPELEKRMKTLLDKEKISFSGIYQFNMSKNSKKANAGFTGIGKSRRIILADTLIENFSVDEIESVFAHELGHYRYRHILKNLVTGSILIIISFYLCSEMYSYILAKRGFIYIYEISALPLLVLLLSVFSFLTMPFINTLSRFYERQADAYAVNAIADKKSFTSSLLKLSKMNLSDTDPHPLIEFLFHGHPSVKKRIAAVSK
jgi:STE24 endopeptidase